jgi:hypothetical protein
MILHIILRRMGQYDAGLHVADQCGDAPEQFHVVENLQTIRLRSVEMRAENPRGAFRLL